jgi:Ca2+-binding RTX toxin-like protein
MENYGAHDWDGERLMQGARLITEMEYQHLVFGEFARLVEPGIAAFTQYNPTLRPDISAEFAHAVYRFGHSMLNPTVERELANGTQVHTPLLGAFTNPALFNNNGSGGNLTGPQAAGAVARGMTGQVGNEMDEFVTNTLRNTLLGQPLDLATLNMLRGRDSGTQPLNGARRALFASTNGDPSLAPYTSWAQFGLALRHPQSLQNFIAAYGTAPSITGVSTLAGKRAAAATMMADASFMNGTGAFADVAGKPTTGLEDIDLWVGGLAEKPVNNLAGSMLGPTFAYVFRTQLEDLQDSDRFYYLGRLAGTNLDNSIEGNTFAEMVMRNTDATSIPVNAFLHPTNIFDMNVAPVPAAITVTAGKWIYPGTGDSVFTGTPGADAMQGGSGDDTMRGNDGPDSVEGSLGNDNVVGGLGNDILTDTGGANIFTAGDGNDYMAGTGGDQYLGGNGHDLMVGTSGATAMIGGPGNDLAYAGNTDDVATGDDNSDWIDGGTGIDILTGDGAPPFSIDLNTPGDDVINGGTGGDIVNGDGGVDMFTSTTSNEGDAAAGGFGFDFQTYGDGTAPVTADLNLAAPPAGVVGPPPDTFLDVEGLSGGSGADVLSGDNRVNFLSATPTQTDNLNQVDIAKFRGMDTLLGIGSTGWTKGNIILGGSGSDQIEGRGGDDLIDADQSLIVRMSVPVTPLTASCPGITGTFVADPADANRVLVSQVLQLRQAVLAGCLDPGAIQYVRTIAPGAPGGTDIAIYSGAKADYTVSGPASRLTITDNRPGSPDGTDTVLNAETLRFSDGDVSTAAPVGPGALAAATIAPASLVQGATGKVTVNFTTAQVLPAKGTVQVTFPAGFDVSNLVAAVAINSGLDGTATAGAAGQAVTITRAGAGTDSAPGLKSITLSGITNPSAVGPTSNFGVATTNATPSPLETGTAPPVTIAAAPPVVSPVVPPVVPPVTPPAAAPGASALSPTTPPASSAVTVAGIAQLSLAKSTASRKGRTVTLVIVPTNASGAVPWKATLSYGRSKKNAKGTVPAGAARQVTKVTVPASWKGKNIAVMITPTAGGTAKAIVLP